ncbi:MAG: hypothetical protein P4K83_09135 [Terracidiphilus sp.]|nr:hypothetical protein [Terracidiphilus sp.]
MIESTCSIYPPKSTAYVQLRSGFLSSHANFLCLIALALSASLPAAPHRPAQSQPLKSKVAWYMNETAMTEDGRLTFLEKTWWPRAQKLREGESFTLDLNHDGQPDTLITRKDNNIVEAIDDSGHAGNIWNTADTAYVVSYGGTGIVDRMVVYSDNDNDGKADEMEIRYYRDGYLRYGWFGENYDKDGAQIFHLTNWQYDGNQFDSKFRGNLMIYVNKYDPVTRTWTPLSECPFAFYDPNHDGLGEIVLRSAVQHKSVASTGDLDHANSYDPMWQKDPLPLKEMEVANMRLSYDIDPEPRQNALTRPHYNFGFTMIGQLPYEFASMRYTNPRRRAPQTVVRMNWNRALETAFHFPASTTAFSWDEAHGVDRWEGQFWIYERRILANTGSPTERWNMRREYMPGSSRERQIYYSPVDQRYHLRGAREMWLEAEHLVHGGRDLEFRAYDTTGDGFFDTWEVFRPGNPVPVRTSHVFKAANRLVPLDRLTMLHEYNEKILPEAIAQDEAFIAEMKKFASSSLASEYEAAAAKAETQEKRRYCLDIARELLFLEARDKLYARNQTGIYQALADAEPPEVKGRGPVNAHYTVEDTVLFWNAAIRIEDFVRAYGEGDFARARKDMQELGTAQPH